MSFGETMLQGRFTQGGVATNKLITLRSDVDWMEVYNVTQAAATNDFATQFYWQRGMDGSAANGAGIYFNKTGGGNGIEQQVAAAGTGFVLVDSSQQTPGAPVAITASTNVVAPVFSAATAGLAVGSIVRLTMDAASGVRNLGGLDIEVGAINPGVSFTAAYNFANGPGVGTGGSYRIIAYDPIFYPNTRQIANVTAANPAVVTTTVSHQYTAGQVIRFNIPSAYGMVELDGLEATITAVTAGTLTLDLDTSTFTAFTFPLNGAVPFTQASLSPVGEAARAPYSNLFDDSTFNQSYLGMVLVAGNFGPGGNANDVIYWRAGTSFSVNNE